MATTPARHIGIVACSAEGAALCYRTICLEAEALMGEHDHPEISMHTYPLAAYMEAIRADDWMGVAELMLGSAQKLAQIGAEFAICPDNTIHQAFAAATERSPIPWLHIAETVAAAARARGFRKLGITGTRYLMTGPVYPPVLEAHGLEYEIPKPEERDEINRIIFDELVKGVIRPESRAYFEQVFLNLSERGCDAVVMGCTEIPLLIDPTRSPLPTLDSTRLLARAALNHALEVAE